MENNHMRATAFLRIVLGLLFLIPGISKIIDPATIISMLGKKYTFDSSRFDRDYKR